MDADWKQEGLKVARRLEEGGDVDGAVQAYMGVGALEPAVLALVNVRRHGDAAGLILKALNVPIERMGELDEKRQKAAKKAAILFAQAGEMQNSIDIFLALGDPMMAATAMEKAGDTIGAARLRAKWGIRGSAHGGDRGSAPSTDTSAVKRLEDAGSFTDALHAYIHLKDYRNAGRVALHLGKPVDAARLFLDGGMPYEAGVCFYRGGDTGMALDSFVRVPRDHPQYRQACVSAIAVAKQLNVLEFSLDNFLARFVASRPENDAEAAALYDLAVLYQTHDFGETAAEVLQTILGFDPKYRDATERLAAVSAEARGSSRSYEKIVRDDAAFHGDRQARADAPRPGTLPDLPSLDDPLPAAPNTAPYASPQQYAPPASGGYPNAPPQPPFTPVSAPTQTPVQPIPASAAAGHAPTTTPDLTGPIDALPPGAIVEGRYVIQREVGRGGMAAVYEAHDREIDERIALKFFFGGAESPELLRRFKLELQLARQLLHPNIVQVYDIGSHRGAKFISMELLEGADLHGVIRMGLSLHRALVYLMQACAGLGLAHERGVVHRDIKPSNFFITRQGPLKVMDFGIAKHMSAPGMTKTGFFAGTPEYMSPEQIQKFGSVTHLTDIYALGMVAYECFTGSAPFVHEELVPILMMQVNDLAPPPSTKNAALPRELDPIVMRCIEKDPAKRYQSCRELALDLDAVWKRVAPR